MSTPKNHLKKSIEANLSPELPRSSLGSPAQRTFVQSWLAVPRKTRLVLSFILFGAALGGLYVSDKLEEKIPAQSPATKNTKSESESY